MTRHNVPHDHTTPNTTPQRTCLARTTTSRRLACAFSISFFSLRCRATMACTWCAITQTQKCQHAHPQCTHSHAHLSLLGLRLLRVLYGRHLFAHRLADLRATGDDCVFMQTSARSFMVPRAHTQLPPYLCIRELRAAVVLSHCRRTLSAHRGLLALCARVCVRVRDMRAR
jgi:hypothetical protein